MAFGSCLRNFNSIIIFIICYLEPKAITRIKIFTISFKDPQILQSLWPQQGNLGQLIRIKKKKFYFGLCCFLLCCFSPSPTLFPVAFAFIPSLLCWASLEENFTPTSSTINSPSPQLYTSLCQHTPLLLN